MTQEEIYAYQDELIRLKEIRIKAINEIDETFRRKVKMLQTLCPHDLDEVSGTENHSTSLCCKACGKVVKL